MTVASTLEVMNEAYENGELEEYLDNMENRFFITECDDWDHVHIYRAIIFTISGCKVNTMEKTITDLDTKEYLTIPDDLLRVIDNYGEFLSGL